jgi:hypothetical protein
VAVFLLGGWFGVPPIIGVRFLGVGHGRVLGRLLFASSS